MRVTVFAAVVAAHIALVWYFLTLRHVAAATEDTEDEPSMTLVFLPPMEPVTTAGTAPGPAPTASSFRRDRWQAPLLYRNTPEGLSRVASAEPIQARESLGQFESTGATSGSSGSAVPRAAAQGPSIGASEPSVAATGVSSETSTSNATANVDWRTQAEIIGQADAQHIVESEDRATRQAGALTAMIKPNHPGPHNPVVPFPWDPNPRYRWQPAGGGAYRMALNDHCEMFVFIMVWVGCSVGELPPARGDLFKNMHPPVKFGDWDWRLDDP